MKKIIILLALVFFGIVATAEFRGDLEILKFVQDGNLSAIKAVIVGEATAQATGNRADLERNKFRTLPDGSVAVAIALEGGSAGGDNIYTADGTLIGDRVVNTGGNELKFSGQIPNSDLAGDFVFSGNVFGNDEKGLALEAKHDQDGEEISSYLFIGDATASGDENKSIKLRIGKSSGGLAQINVFLESFNSSKLSTIVVVKDFLGLGLSDAKVLVESAPVVVLEDTTQAIADDFVAQLTGAGATAYVQYVSSISKEAKINMQYNNLVNSPKVSMIASGDGGDRSFVEVVDQKVTAKSKLVELGSEENSEALIRVQGTSNLPGVVIERFGGEVLRITDKDFSNDLKIISDWYGNSLDLLFDGGSGNLQVLTMETGGTVLGNNKLISGQGFGEIEFRPSAFGESSFNINSREVAVGNNEIGSLTNVNTNSVFVSNIPTDNNITHVVGKNGTTGELKNVEVSSLGNVALYKTSITLFANTPQAIDVSATMKEIYQVRYIDENTGERITLNETQTSATSIALESNATIDVRVYITGQKL